MNSSKILIPLVPMVTLLTSAPGAFAQTPPRYPIAYISVQKILSDAEDAKAGSRELETMRQARAKDLAAKKQALDATKLEVANTGGVFSTSKRQQLAEQAKRQETELQQATQQAQADFAELQKTIQDRLRLELNTVVTALATERRVMYVLNQDAALVMAPAGANWTDDVLQRLNAISAARSGADKAPPHQKAPAKNP